MSKKAARREEALVEIAHLKASRRKSVLTCAAALVVILAVIAGKAYLTAIGLIEPDSMVANAVVMFSSIGLAVLGGSASINFTRSGHRIAYLRQRANLSNEDIKTFAR